MVFLDRVEPQSHIRPDLRQETLSPALISFHPEFDITDMDGFDSSGASSNICGRCGSQLSSCRCFPAYSSISNNPSLMQLGSLHPSLGVGRLSASGTGNDQHDLSRGMSSASAMGSSSVLPCSCLRDLLRISEESQYHQKNLDSAPLEKTLAVANGATRICKGYLRCQHCAEALNTMLSVNALQQASACYRYLVDTTLLQDRKRAEGGEAEGSFHKVRVGTFECELSLHSDVWRSIIDFEIKKAAEVVAEGLGTNEDGTMKKSWGMDEITMKHHQAVLGRVSRELSETLEMLAQNSG